MYSWLIISLRLHCFGQISPGCNVVRETKFFKKIFLTLLHSEWPKLYGVLDVLSAIGLKNFQLPSTKPGTVLCCCHLFNRESVTFCLLPWAVEPFKHRLGLHLERSTLKEKNLLLQEQILCLKRWPPTEKRKK